MKPKGLSLFTALAKSVSKISDARQAGKSLPSKFKPKFDEKDFMRGVHELEERIAAEYEKQLKDNIRRNKFGYSLPEGTRKRKKGAYQNVPLMETKEYVEKGIVRKGKIVTVRDGKHKSGLSYAELASIHEYGRRDKSIPARPVWRRTFDDFKPTAKQMVEKFLYPKGRKRRNL